MTLAFRVWGLGPLLYMPRSPACWDVGHFSKKRSLSASQNVLHFLRKQEPEPLIFVPNAFVFKSFQNFRCPGRALYGPFLLLKTIFDWLIVLCRGSTRLGGLT